MALWQKDFSVTRRIRHGCEIDQVLLVLEIEISTGAFISYPFRLDTGSDLTTIPKTLLKSWGVSAEGRIKKRGVRITGVAGTGTADIASVWYSLRGLRVKFECQCCLSDYPLTLPLLSLHDVASHFHLESFDPVPQHPHGFLQLRLKANHGGDLRS